MTDVETIIMSCKENQKSRRLYVPRRYVRAIRLISALTVHCDNCWPLTTAIALPKLAVAS